MEAGSAGSGDGKMERLLKIGVRSGDGTKSEECMEQLKGRPPLGMSGGGATRRVRSDRGGRKGRFRQHSWSEVFDEKALDDEDNGKLVSSVQQALPSERLSVSYLNFPSDNLYESNEALNDVCNGNERGPQRAELFYQFQDVIGYGMDVVMLAVANGTTMEVAIKRISKQRSVEVDILRRLRHEKLVKVYGIHKYSKEDFIDVVMEYSRDGDLFDFLSVQKQLSESTVCSVIAQVLTGLKFLHENGVVHRDVKAENVLLAHQDGNLRVKLADFGISEIVSADGWNDESSVEGPVTGNSVPGTPGYMAPEHCDFLLRHSNQAEEQNRIFHPSRAVDLFACGVLLYVMLSGKFPEFYTGRSAFEVYEKTAKAEFRLDGSEWDNVSADAKHILRRLLQRDPAQRITAKEALALDWFQGQASDTLIGNDLSKADQDARKLFLFASLMHRSRCDKPRRRRSENDFVHNGLNDDPE